VPESVLERDFLLACREMGLPESEREYRFDAKRRWRIDFAWPEHRVAVEIEGGDWSGGRHLRGKGFNLDASKYNALTLAGWRLLRFTGTMIETDPFGCVRIVKELLDHA